jgi:hypothetical protein
VRSIDALTYATISTTKLAGNQLKGTCVVQHLTTFDVSWLMPLFSYRLIDLLASSSQTATPEILLIDRHLYFALDARFFPCHIFCSVHSFKYRLIRILSNYRFMATGRTSWVNLLCSTFWHQVRDTTFRLLVAWGPKMRIKKKACCDGQSVTTFQSSTHPFLQRRAHGSTLKLTILSYFQ